MFRRIWKLISSTFQIWSRTHASRMAAALTYFTMLSLAPLLMIAIAIAGYVFGDQLAEKEVIEKVQFFADEKIAEIVANLIHNATRPSTGLVASSISLLILLFAASGVFTQLHDTFNEVWQVPIEKRSGLLYTLRQRLFGVIMVLLVGILLLASLVLSGLLSTINNYMSENFPRSVSWLNLLDRGLMYLALPLVLSLVFWLVPSIRIRWSDALPAAMLTAVLVSASRVLIELYLRFSSTSEVYGAAGSLVVLLIWIYITGLVIFFGAAFSRAWTETFGSRREDKLLEPAVESEPSENNKAADES